MLIIATIGWGGSFSFTKHLLVSVSVVELLFLRFSFTFLLMIPILFAELIFDKKKLPIIHTHNRFDRYRTWILLLILGVLNVASLQLQTWGLETISAANSGFITSLFVVFIPFLQLVFYKTRISYRILLSLIIALGGVYLFSYGLNLPDGFIFGDMVTLASAFLFGFYIIIIDELTPKIKATFLVLSMYFISVICLIPFMSDRWNEIGNLLLLSNFSFWLILLVVFGTVIPYTLMMKGQHLVQARVASYLYLLEPIFAVIAAYWLLEESVGWLKMLGAAFILSSQILVIQQESKKRS